MTLPFAGRVESACDLTVEALSGTPLADQARQIRRALDSPLRVAIVGRVKAGKSTLLNALLRERLAPTDAGECTRFVCVYRHGQAYDVGAELKDGRRIGLPFSRGEDTLNIDLEAAPAPIERLDIAWPASALSNVTLLDTPGIGSTDEAVRLRVAGYLAGQDHSLTTDADAVIYVMRHLHATDVKFMEALHSETIVSASPVNAVAVLSRADEVCGGRADAMVSASRIAARYRADPTLRASVADVVPMAGLLAETGATLRESEMTWLRTLAAADSAEIDSLMLSVDRFRRPGVGPLMPEVREILLTRLGLFGLRFAVDAIAHRRCDTAVALSRALTEISGITALRDLIDEYFVSRSQRLKARSALLQLSALARVAEEFDARVGRLITQTVETLASTAHELAELRLLHLALTGAAGLDEAELAAIRDIVSEKPLPGRLGLAADASADEQRTAALRWVAHWRERGASPVISRDLATASEIAARSYEGVYAALGN